MPGKSRHGKARQQLSKKRKEKQQSALNAAQQAVPAQTADSAAAAKLAPRASTPKSAAAPVVAQYPYVGAELVRICIVTGLVLVILFVLAMVSSRP